MSRVLLHACCAPCAAPAVECLRRLGHKVTVLFANPNIAPRAEFDRRLAAVQRLAERMAVPLLVDVPDHEAWRAAVHGLETEPEGATRCRVCFRHNLGRAAARLAKTGCDAFATSLTTSPLKCVGDVLAAGRETGGERFLPLVFGRDGGYARSVALSQELGLYRQRNCGCEFSRRPPA